LYDLARKRYIPSFSVAGVVDAAFAAESAFAGEYRTMMKYLVRGGRENGRRKGGREGGRKEGRIHRPESASASHISLSYWRLFLPAFLPFLSLSLPPSPPSPLVQEHC